MFLRRSAPFGAPDGPTAITGTVTDAATGAPLLNVRLQFYTASGINFGLALGGTITGVVTDAGIGAPLANLLVLTYATSDPHGSCVWAVRCSDHPALGSPIRGVLFTC